MHLDSSLWPRQSGCISCPDPPPCNCNTATEQCFQISRGCNTCSSFKCVPLDSGSSNSGSHGVNKGALVGGIIGALLFVVVVFLGVLWYRRRRTLASGSEHVKEDIPAPASTVLNRPDPTEKPPPPTELSTVRVYSNSSNTTIDLDPQARSNAVASSPPYVSSRVSDRTNPFSDTQSIQTTGTDGTNVIPIALVAPPGSSMTSSALSQSGVQSATTPMRPTRSPELNLDHVNISHESLRTGSPSQRSGISGVSSRNSYMSNASYSSDFLNETAMMITPAVRQVLGVVKAEVIQTPMSPGSNASPSPGGLKSPSRVTRLGPSPLATASYGPADLAKEYDEGHEISVHGDPFDDQHSSMPVSGAATVAPSPNPSTVFSASISSPPLLESSEWLPESPNQPWNQSGDDSRPSSMSTQSGTIDIGSATRVNVSLGSATSPLDGGAALHHRTTVGRLVAPSTDVGTLEEQQQRALAHARARAQAQGLDKNRRVSNSSVLSAASTRADSILESFPFVPPSPISDRPIRSPPHSPLAQQVFNGSSATKEAPRAESTEPKTKPSSPTPTPTPPNRRVLGLSTGSDFSTLSSGLGSFPFQIDSVNGGNVNASPSAFKGRQRASLDTLALTSDLSSYPLGFDRDTTGFKKGADPS